MVQTNPDGRTHIHRTKIVTTMSRLPAEGLENKNVSRGPPWKFQEIFPAGLVIKNGSKTSYSRAVSP